MSEEVAQAAGDIAYWRRRAETAEAMARTLQGQRDEAEAANRQAAVEIARLREAMRQAARMFTIKGARKIVEDAIGAEP